jgi:hypothetical protein
MACIDCNSENVEANKRSCVECFEKIKLEEIEAYRESMKSLDRLLLYCETNKDYKENRDRYDRCRLEVLYLTNQIPRPDKRKATQRERNDLFRRLDELISKEKINK